MQDNTLSKIYPFGVDYYPEHWPEACGEKMLA